MFCCLNNKKSKKQKASYCRGMAVGGILTIVSLMILKIKTCICKKDQNQQLSNKEDSDFKENKDYEKSKLEDKIEEFNSRRLTVENESKNKNL